MIIRYLPKLNDAAKFEGLRRKESWNKNQRQFLTGGIKEKKSKKVRCRGGSRYYCP